MPAKRSLEKEYQHFTQEEHVLARPGMYIGNTATVTDEVWIHDDETQRMVKRSVTYNPGIVKLFDELITNCLDETVRDNTITAIKVKVTGTSFSVENDGDRGIPIEKHPTGKCWLPEYLFGRLLTSSNYDDTQEREVAGTNGIGAKAANIFSTTFEVDIINSGKQYKQQFTNNMKNTGEPKITKTKAKNRVSLTCHPDFARFGMQDFTNDGTVAVLQQRSIEVASMCGSAAVYWNGTKFTGVRNFEDYMALYLGPNKGADKVPRLFWEGRDWKVCIAFSPWNEYVQVSTVNGCHTKDGGTHVDHVVNPLCKKVAENLTSKNKDLTVQTRFVKDTIFVGIQAKIPNPQFSSQSKDCLITQWKDFRGRFKVEDEFCKKVEKLGILDTILATARAKDLSKLKSGKPKQQRLTNIPKLNDANWAGSAKSSQCTLILTEGDSAKSMAISGIQNRDTFGVFPLKGKLLNTRGMAPSRIDKNEEIKSIVQIMGLVWNKRYRTSSDLRYGKILVMTDQDDDGFHIKGLLINFFEDKWPELLEIPGFISSMLTPVIKARKGTKVIEFYNTADYHKWKKKTTGSWNIKYYKGLGTSTSAEAKEYFKRMDIMEYQIHDKKDRDSVNKAFHTDLADDRKLWIRDYLRDPGEIDYTVKHVPIKDFIDKELVLYSCANVNRSIPSIMDGLKPSQRKVLYCCFKRGLTKELKVAQLAGYVSEHSAYHHGEMSLNGTIVGMAQTFVGHNNINLLEPCGQFGTRMDGGSDSASPRYIFTHLTRDAYRIYSTDDNVLLDYNDDDGMQIEPKFYLPTIPMALANGFDGIATGFSSKCPCFNPDDLKNQIRILMRDPEAELPVLTPWYLGFKGAISTVDKNKWITEGIWQTVSASSVRITELPVGTWTNKYIEELKKMETAGAITRYDDHCTEVDINITVSFPPGRLAELKSEDKVETELKLRTKLGATNLHVIDTAGIIRYMETPSDIVREFFRVRKHYYGMRREYLIEKARHDSAILEAKINFIRAVGNKELDIIRMRKADVVTWLTDQGYYRPKADKDFGYLLDMKIQSMSLDRIEALEAQLADRREFGAEMERTSDLKLWESDLT